MLNSGKEELRNYVEGDSDSYDCMSAQTGSCSSYDKVVNHLLLTYEGNSTIYATKAAITSLQKLPK